MRNSGSTTLPHPGPLPLGEGTAFGRIHFLVSLLSYIRFAIVLKPANDSPSPSGIQLLGFSQRVIKVLRSDVQSKLRHRKPCPTTVNTFSEKLRIKRLEIGLTQPEMAGNLGVSRYKLGLWERGHATPTEAQRLNISAAVGITA